MPAKNFSLAGYGATDDVTSTGLYIGEVSWTNEADKVDLKNHVGTTIGFTLADPRVQVKCSGAIVSKTVGIVPAVASVIVLANTAANTQTLTTKNHFATPVANAGTVVLGGTFKRASSEYETGDLDAIYHPGVVTNAPVSVAD